MDIRILPGYEYQKEIEALFSEYTQELIRGDGTFEEYLSMQHYDEELSHPEEKYGLPGGRLYLALCGEEAAGCIALHRIDDENCEIKRLYVRPAYRGRQIGTRLVEQVIEDAKAIGYRHILLDTFPFLKSAIGIYEKYGFYEIPRYLESPMQKALYMQKDL